VDASAQDVAVILDNLIENALEHSAPATTVEIELETVGDWGSIAVADAGPGLAEGEEERVFERFVRGSSRGARPRGSGLGLTIVRVLARRWGGDARIANRPQGGARAEVRLPLAAIDGEAPAQGERALDGALTGES
jgi:signal transduction histidine kinase